MKEIIITLIIIAALFLTYLIGLHLYADGCDKQGGVVVFQGGTNCWKDGGYIKVK